MAPSLAISPLDRLDDYRKEERCITDTIANTISLHLYGKHYDQLPHAERRRVEMAALHAIRASQLTWNQYAAERAWKALDDAMCQELGMAYAAQPLERRKTLARIGAVVVQQALCNALDLANPFVGNGDALRVYEAADAAVKDVQ